MGNDIRLSIEDGRLSYQIEKMVIQNRIYDRYDYFSSVYSNGKPSDTAWEKNEEYPEEFRRPIDSADVSYEISLPNKKLDSKLYGNSIPQSDYLKVKTNLAVKSDNICQVIEGKLEEADTSFVEVYCSNKEALDSQLPLAAKHKDSYILVPHHPQYIHGSNSIYQIYYEKEKLKSKEIVALPENQNEMGVFCTKDRIWILVLRDHQQWLQSYDFDGNQISEGIITKDEGIKFQSGMIHNGYISFYDQQNFYHFNLKKMELEAIDPYSSGSESDQVIPDDMIYLNGITYFIGLKQDWAFDENQMIYQTKGSVFIAALKQGEMIYQGECIIQDEVRKDDDYAYQIGRISDLSITNE